MGDPIDELVSVYRDATTAPDVDLRARLGEAVSLAARRARWLTSLEAAVIATTLAAAVVLVALPWLDRLEESLALQVLAS